MRPARPATGIWLYPVAPAPELVDAIVLAEAMGIDEVWVADEGVARDPFVVLAAAAARTSRIRLGIGITTPALRHPGHLAAAAASLDEVSSGRALLGLGVGGHESLEPFGLTVERPVALVRDAIRTARAVFGRVAGPGFDPPAHASPARAVPVYVGARGEQLNRLASREADGVFLSGFVPSALGPVVGWARSVRPIAVALYASVRFASDGPDDPTALRGSARAIASALTALVDEHAPASIGLALVDQDPPVDMVRRAAEVFEAL